MKIGIVGCGVIGERRADFLPEDFELAGFFDPSSERCKVFEKKYPSGKACSSLEELFSLPDLKAVFICTINSALTTTAQAALDRGLHILVEKPAARSLEELQSLKNPHNCVVKIGFNHRFHPAFEDICQELANNPQDPVMYIRASYGNGARLGFDQEWRSKPEIAGGGELLDQGVHVLDLAGHILPRLQVAAGWCRTHYWKMPVDDNSWGWLSSPEGQSFSFHVSSSEWKNEFRFEVYTRQRKYQWIGLGRSYGPETLTLYKMKPEMGPPVVEEKHYPERDDSWFKENKNFALAIQKGETPNGTLEDAKRVLSWVKSLYESSRKNLEKTQFSFPHPHWFGENK